MSRWRGRYWHKTSHQQDQRCFLQNKTCLEINSIFQKNQTEVISRLCPLYSFIWLRMALSTFHTKCLRNIMRIFWPQIISNKQLFRTTGQDTMSNTLATRRWRWIGHVLRKKDDRVSKTALRWTPVGERKRGRPKKRGGRQSKKNWNNYIWIGVRLQIKLQTGQNGGPLFLPVGLSKNVIVYMRANCYIISSYRSSTL